MLEAECHMEIAALYHQGRITLRRDLGTSGPATVLGATSMILRWWVERPSWEERGDGGMRDFHCCPLWDQRSDETRSCRVFLCFFCFKRFCFQALKGGVSRLSRGRSSPTRSARGRCVLQWKLSRPMGHLPIAGLPGTLGFGSTLFWRGTWLSSTGRTYRSLHDLDVLGFEWAKHIACLCFSTTRVLILSFFHESHESLIWDVTCIVTIARLTFCACDNMWWYNYSMHLTCTI